MSKRIKNRKGKLGQSRYNKQWLSETQAHRKNLYARAASKESILTVPHHTKIKLPTTQKPKGSIRNWLVAAVSSWIPQRFARG